MWLLAFILFDYLMDLMNYEEPGQKIGKDYYIPVSINMQKKVDRYLSAIYLNSDNGWLIDDLMELEYPVFLENKESFFLYGEVQEEETRVLMELTLRKSNMEKK